MNLWLLGSKTQKSKRGFKTFKQYNNFKKSIHQSISNANKQCIHVYTLPSLNNPRMLITSQKAMDQHNKFGINNKVSEALL